TYTNSSLGFSIKYPSNATPSLELNDEHNRMTAFGQISGRYFEVRLHDDTDPDMGVKYGFLGAEITSTNTTVAGIRGFRAVSEAGYGDAGVQGSPYVNFGVRKNNLVYHVLFYGDANISAEEQAILQTFKLLN
ncbi:MAG TPA: hypothetical protein PKD79_03995, partial [Candidatus Doudnabacteria bacterium]|nr:hypothetical protein [Candidatus Doudnabacteria bacterium]